LAEYELTETEDNNLQCETSLHKQVGSVTI